jgi:hypothetical protein
LFILNFLLTFSYVLVYSDNGRGGFMIKKLIITTILLYICISFAHSQTAINLDQAVENGSRYLSGRFSKGTRATIIAIKTDNPELGEFVLKKMSTVLVNSGWFTVVERNQSALDALSQEMDYQMSGHVSETTELSIGKQLGAEIIISGTFSRSGQNWRLDLQALRVESAQIGGQWSAENIRSDPAWASLASSQNASVSFSGDELSGREKQTITDGLRNSIQTWKTGLDLDEQSLTQTGFNFTITVYKNKLPSDLLQAEVSIAFLRNGRMVIKGDTFYITEMTDVLIALRIAERLNTDRTFFNRVNEVIR